MLDDARLLVSRMQDLLTLSQAVKRSADPALQREAEEIQAFLRQSGSFLHDFNEQAAQLFQSLTARHASHLVALLLERQRGESNMSDTAASRPGPEYVEPEMMTPSGRELAIFLGDRLRLSPGTLANTLLLMLVQSKNRPLRVRALARELGKSAAAVSKAFHELETKLGTTDVGYRIYSERTGDRAGFRLEPVGNVAHA